MSATLTTLHDPGKVIVQVDCEHGTFTSTLLLAGPEISADEGEALPAFAQAVVAGHRRDFGCGCEVETLVNGEIPIQ